LIALLFAVYDAHGKPRQAAEGATVWMLDYVQLNQLTTLSIPPRENEAPLAWVNQPTLAPTRDEVLSWLIALAGGDLPNKADGTKYQNTAEYLATIRASMPSNIGAANVRRAWGDPGGTDFPVAVLGTSVHPRITAQQGCFTIHGKAEISLSQLVDEKLPDPGASSRTLRQYKIHGGALDSIRSDLRMAGMTYSTVFPDLDGLTVHLRSWY
jgi:hypothetical protein